MLKKALYLSMTPPGSLQCGIFLCASFCSMHLLRSIIQCLRVFAPLWIPDSIQSNAANFKYTISNERKLNTLCEPPLKIAVILKVIQFHSESAQSKGHYQHMWLFHLALVDEAYVVVFYRALVYWKKKALPRQSVHFMLIWTIWSQWKKCPLELMNQ